MTFRGCLSSRSLILLGIVLVCVQGYDPHCTEFGKYCPTDLGNLSSNLIAYYTFSNPDRYKDLTGITGDLTDTGGATFQSDCAWNGAECVVFAGGSALTTPSIPFGMMGIQNGFTVCYWINIYTLTQGTWPMVFTDGGTNRIEPFINGGTVYFQIRSSTGTPGVAIGITAYTPIANRWYHMCYTSLRGVWNIYLDSVVVRTNSWTNHIWPSSLRLPAVGMGSFSGSIDGFRVYNRALTAAEIMQVYQFRQYTCPPGTFQDLQENCSTRVEKDLIAYYSFCPENRLRDTTGITGSLTDSGSVTFQSDGPWTSSQTAVFSGSNRVSVNSVNFQALQNASGVTVCFWLYISSATAFTYPFYTPGMYTKFASASQLNGGIAGGEFAIVTNWANMAWNHVCFLKTTTVVQAYVNNVLRLNSANANLPSSSTTLYIGSAVASGYITGQMDEFRIYKRQLSAEEVSQIYSTRPTTCSAGICPGVPVTSSCQPCPVGTFQSYPGQQSCLGCSGGHASFPGSVRCAGDGRKGPRPSATSSSTPGTIVYTVGPNYLTFNCPGGTFSSTVVQLSSTLTSNAFTSDNNVACAGTPCVWMSSQIQTTRRTATLIDGSISNDVNTVMAHTQCNVANPYFGIDFGSSQFVAGVLVFDRDELLSVAQRLNGFRIYIGNNLLPVGSTTTTPTAGGNGWSYPIADVTNTLCYTGRSDDAGYRSPVWASCGASGRYLYIVGTANNCLHLQEIIVLSSPPCTSCTPGKFSTYAQPNTVCAECPAGSYNTAAGMTFCQACMAGYVQPEPGKTYCIPAAPPGSYNPPVASAFASELVAYYPFYDTNPLLDVVSGTTSVTHSGATFISSSRSTGEQTMSLDFTDTASIPLPNWFGNAAGFSLCFWIQLQNITSDFVYIGEGRHTSSTLLWQLRKTLNTNSVGVYWMIGNGGTMSSTTTFSLSSPAWIHVCLSNVGTSNFLHVNGAQENSNTGTGITQNLAGVFNFKTTPQNNAIINIDEFRIYSRKLETPEIAAIWAFRAVTPCPIGSFQDQPAQDTCKPCPIGTFQNVTGQSTCTTCATATWTGTSKCDSSFSQLNRAVGSSLTQTPGMTQIFTNAAGFITFPCPSGTFGTRSTVISNLTIPSSSSASVYWADLGSSVYVDSIIVTDTTSLNQNQMTIYLGNTNYGTGVYPVSTSLNAPCDLDRLATRGYRNPAVYYCQKTGRYINIVAASGTLAISTVVATNQPICTLCSPGTFSFNTIPTVKCSQCPAGTYQTGSGKSTCDSCPTGTFQSGLGMTSATSCVPINSGLIAHYTFSPGGRLRDSTGITGDLTLINNMNYIVSGPWPTSHSAWINSAGYFSMPGMNFGSMSLANGFSICCWASFIRNAALYWNSLFNCEATPTFDEFFITSQQGGGLKLYAWRAGTSGWTSDAVWSQNVWTHVCVTVLQGNWIVYMNAVPVRTMPRSLENTILTSCTIGGTVSGSGFTGSIDDFRIYNRAITQQEVATLFNMKSGAPCNSTAYCSEGRYCPVELDSSCPNLIDYYTFPASNRVLDSTGTTGNLIPFGTITYISDCAWTGAQCANFDGTTAYYTFPTINIGALEAASGLAICLWFNPTSTSGTPTIFQLGNGNANNNVILSIVSSKLRFTVYSGSTPSFIEFPLQVTANTWRHICIDGNAPNNWDLYDNGVPVLLAQTIDAPSTNLSTNTIGRDMTSSIYFSGRIDEFRIYNRNLSPQEIMDLYNYRDLPCPVGHFCPPGTAIPIPCPAGKYQASTGSSSCTNCPNGFYSTLTGSSSLSQCTSCS